jgi:hypothetical protein
MSPTLFNIYIDKLEGCLKEAGCVDPTLIGIVIILLLCIDDIVLMVRNPYDLYKQLKIFKDLCSSTCMNFNTNKMKVMIIKSKNITYANCMYANNNLEEVTSYKYLEIDLHCKHS